MKTSNREYAYFRQGVIIMDDNTDWGYTLPVEPKFQNNYIYHIGSIEDFNKFMKFYKKIEKLKSKIKK